MSKNQMIVIKKYIDDMLKKYIKFNISKYAISILIVKKSKKKFRIFVNYRAFNAFTMKNRDTFFL